MTFRIRSLFLKIFLWFWATVILIGISLVLTWIVLQPKNLPFEQRANLADAAWISGNSVVEELQQHGASATSAYMEQVSRKTHLRSCLFDASGKVISGHGCANFGDVGALPAPLAIPQFNMQDGLLRVAVRVRAKSGDEYIYAVEAMERHGPPPGIGPLGILLRWTVPLLVSGLICYLLTRYLTTPILRLRAASQLLAAGDLSTRASQGMERRHDELGSLVRDFNSMADRLEALVSRQRQLIYDISHELRSPLARLNVALDLGRQRKGDDPAFVQAEHDIACLDEMIGRLLTVARLDTATATVSMAPVNLNALLESIVRSAGFEMQERQGAIHWSAKAEFVVLGNAELLHSAIENVIRNAVRYTGHGNSVDVSLDSAGEPAFARILVRDHGPGVPDQDLLNIFQPFYRVADDRNRESGGTGLGLAIADRVVRIHGGTITARNMSPHGLEVEVHLPLGTANDSIHRDRE